MRESGEVPVDEGPQPCPCDTCSDVLAQAEADYRALMRLMLLERFGPAVRTRRSHG